MSDANKKPNTTETATENKPSILTRMSNWTKDNVLKPHPVLSTVAVAYGTQKVIAPMADRGLKAVRDAFVSRAVESTSSKVRSAAGEGARSFISGGASGWKFGK